MSKNKKLIIKILLWISRIFFGLVFIFSGFVKAIDPLGSAYKFEDYFIDAFGMDWMLFTALPLALIMNIVELVVGFAILFGLHIRITAWLGLLFMAFFTPLTLYIALTDPVSDCGCFGEAIIFSNWETFYKNIFLSVAILIVFFWRNKIKPLISNKADLITLGIFTILGFMLSAYCLRNLPVIDFRPWKIGNYIPEQMEDIKPAEVNRYYIYKNIETGEEIEVTEDKIMQGEIPEASLWEFVKRKENVIDPGIPAPIANFAIYDEYGYDVTDYYFSYPGYIFLVVSYDLNKANKNAYINKINPLFKKAERSGIPVVFLSASLQSDIEKFQQNLNVSYNFYEAEDRELKTIVRSNPGLVLMKEGVMIDKWAHKNIPAFEDIEF